LKLPGRGSTVCRTRLCRELDRNLIMSEDFVRHLDSPVFEIGYFRLRGFSRMQLLFGLFRPGGRRAWGSVSTATRNA
jgi:hypothetical protein